MVPLKVQLRNPGIIWTTAYLPLPHHLLFILRLPVYAHYLYATAPITPPPRYDFQHDLDDHYVHLRSSLHDS